MKINISELAAIAELLFNHVRDLGNEDVDLDVDYYWWIDKNHVYNAYVEPAATGMTLGQLEFDWDNLKEIAHRESPPVGYSLVWLSTICRAVGEKVMG